MNEVKRLEHPSGLVRLLVEDAALLQAVVDAARKREHHDLDCATQERGFNGMVNVCNCGFHETIDSLEKIDARLAEKERT